MSRFKYVGESYEILSARGEEVELIPGAESVEISDALQQNEYCIRLINSGRLQPLGDGKESQSETRKDKDTKTKESGIYPDAGYPLYLNMGVMDWVRSSISEGIAHNPIYEFIGEKTVKEVTIKQWEKDREKALKEWAKEHPNEPLPPDTVAAKLAEFKEADEAWRPLPRWRGGKRSGFFYLPDLLLGGEFEKKAWDGYPFFRYIVTERYPGEYTVEYPTLSRRTYILTTTKLGYHKGSAPHVVTRELGHSWFNDLKAAINYELAAAMLDGGTLIQFKEPEFVTHARQLIVVNEIRDLLKVEPPRKYKDRDPQRLRAMEPIY